MKSIDTLIQNSGFNFLLNPREFKDIKPWGADYLCDFIEDIRANPKSKVIILPDPDVDGVVSAKEMQDLLILTTTADVDVYRHSYRMHGLTMPILYNILKGDYTHVVIVDSASNDIKELEWLVHRGLHVIVIDHHMPNYSLAEYPEGLTILNNKLCLKEGIKVPYKEVSCGALVALYCNYVYAVNNLVLPPCFWTYAVLTLYSDGMDLFDEFNIMLIAHARQNSYMDDMLSNISSRKEISLHREVLTYSISPKINSCLKANNFNPVLELFFNRTNSSKRQKELCKELNCFNGYIKERMSQIETSLQPTIVGSVGLVDMTQFINDELIDFKGTIANRIAEQVGKLVIAYYVKNGVCYASVRDPFNRDALSVFQDVSNSAGHKSAFGFSEKEELLESIVRYVNLSFEEVSSTRKNPIIVPLEEYDITPEDIQRMAIVNEYAINNGIFIKVFIDPNSFRIDNYRGHYTVRSARIQLIGSAPVNYGDTVLAIPTLGPKTIVKIKTIVRS